MKKTTLMTHLLPALAIVVLGSTVSIPQTVSAQSVTDEDAEPQLAVAKIRGTDQTRIYEVIDGMAITEGDIVLGTHEEVQANGILPLAVNPPPTGPQPQQRGAIVADPDKRWPNGVVPYTLADGSSNGTINSVEAGIAEWEAKTSIRFVPRTNQSDYVEFRSTGNTNVCSTVLGRVGGRQFVNFALNGTGCMTHEIGHVLGLVHEQNRNDRDEFVNIDFSNLNAGGAAQMQKATFATDVGQYDFQSIMHYGPFTGAIDKSSPTIRPVDPSIPVSAVGTRGVITASDAEAVNFLYGNPSSPNSSGDWEYCALENGRCDFSGTKRVAYGEGTKWNYEDGSNGVNCNTSVFGDPIPGTYKACFFDAGSSGSGGDSGSPGSDSTNFKMVKRNASSFAIDGGGGAKVGRSVELYTNLNHDNLTWTEIDRGNGHFAYQKLNTNVCMDGGNGGANGQNVTLQTCDSSDVNQQWQKINIGSDHYQLQKRGTNFSLDGKGGGAINQNVYLWSSNSTNQNQHWRFEERP